MNINFEWRRNARNGGGLFVGIKLHFPTSLCDDADCKKRWKNILIQIGLIVYTVNINIDYAHKYVEIN